MRVLIAPDKFKGTLTARQAAEAIASGWLKSRPSDTVEVLPISDGGDGFGPVMADFLNGRERRVRTVDAAHRERESLWWWVQRERKAIIETAQVIGLALLPPKLFHPFALDTRGLAALLLAVQEAGAVEAMLGIGGSATNDAGFGLAQALGWSFRDSRGTEIRTWTALDRLHEVAPPRNNPLATISWTVAVDVKNPLLGPLGASRVYGPQKGLTEADMPRAEAALERLADRAAAALGRDFALLPGAGAAGGLGFGLAAFLGARLQPGFERVALEANLEDRVRQADLVIAAEGMIDPSTAMGKGAGELALTCARLGKPCVGLAGFIAPGFEKQLATSGFIAVHAICPQLASHAESFADPTAFLEKLAERVAATEPSLPQVDRA